MPFGGAVRVNKQPGPDWALPVLRRRAGVGPGSGAAGAGGGSPRLPARGRRRARPGKQAHAVIGRVIRRPRPLPILHKAGPGRAGVVPEFESRIRPFRSVPRCGAARSAPLRRAPGRPRVSECGRTGAGPRVSVLCRGGWGSGEGAAGSEGRRLVGGGQGSP